MQAQAPANRLRELREARGLRPYELSVKVRASEATISRWERGLSNIPDSAKVAFADFFEVPVSYLMGWDEKAA